MTDGPFRNSRLSTRWQKFGEQLVSDAASPAERVKQACHSMMTDAGVREFSSMVRDLSSCLARSQLTLDPVADVEAVIERHLMSSLSDILRRTLIANLHDGVSPAEALQPAMEATTQEWIGIVKNRLEEHCIQARDMGDMSRADYQKGLERNAEAFSSIDVPNLCQAMKVGDRRAFSSPRLMTVDEGPE
ncbi:hypothetical protein [Pelagibacterium luteolum]|uniref:Uncharacterized protein n=1 Tax=Pelagibacterium luteolum TaxID=440168 RepID=A0A1G7Y3Q8_9HYPH|nr:hypothetical protein [Pelagibacterium luteolum]SDG90630.1 hypothetical protein SAMN04487974_11215 [Pelagibacterium luteolum]